MDLGCHGERGLIPVQQSKRGGLARGLQAGFTLIELMVVVAIIGILASIGIPVFMNFVKQAQTSDPIQNAASMASSINGMLGVGKTPAQVAAIFASAVIEDGDGYTAMATNRAISAALSAMAWSPSSGSAWRYSVTAKVNTASSPALLVCVMATAGATATGTWAVGSQTNGKDPVVYYSSVPSAVAGWTGNTFTGQYVSGTALVAGGACSATGAAVDFNASIRTA